MIITTNRILLIFCYIIATNISFAQIAINEIMPAPLDGQPEWIELFNSEDNSINLINTTISDLTTNRKLPDFSIPSGAFAIIVKDTNLLKSFYSIPNGTVLVQATIPTLNNTTDAVVFKDSTDRVIDSVYYDLKWGEKGLSLERLDFSNSALSRDNWGASINPLGATPGELNSIATINYDISCSSVKLSTDFSNFEIVIKNSGKQGIEKFNFVLKAMLTNKESILIDEEIFFVENLHFSELDTLIVVPTELAKIKMSKSEAIELTSIVYSPNDQRRLNDTARASLYLRIQEPVIKINEVMFDITNDFAEYVEIWNGGKDTLIMDNFVIWDAAGSLLKGNVRIESDNFKIAPDGFGVVTWDSSFFEHFSDLLGKENVYYVKSSFNLNLAGDLIVFADASGKIYDSLTYSNSWHSISANDTKNRSLEKISPNLDSYFKENWTTCADNSGGTPAKMNSVSSINKKEGALSIEPNPFAPNSGGADANAIINYELPLTKAYISAFIYDISGYEVAQLANNRYTGAIGSLVWDGRNSDGYIVQVGQYVLLVESTDIDSGSVYQQKALIVVGN